jgi:hypothetical protein
MKAQMKMLESVAVLIIFFILLIIGSSVYFGIQNSNLLKERRVQNEVDILRDLVKLQSLPELDCSFSSARTVNCFDLFKLQAVSEISDEISFIDFYYPVFGDVSINISVLFPFQKSFIIYDARPERFNSYIKKRLPVLVYNPLNSRYYFAVSELTRYD